MSFLNYLQQTAFTEWVLTAMLGFPTLIALHSVGMGAVVGLTFVIALRLNGVVAVLDRALLVRFVNLAVWGFTLNLITGLMLFVTRGQEYLETGIFLIKMLLVLLSAALVAWIGQRLKAGPDAAATTKGNKATRAMEGEPTGGADVIADPLSARLAVLATVFWFGAVVAGRLIAYVSELY